MSEIEHTEIHVVPTIGEVNATVQYTRLSASTRKVVLSVVRTDGRAMAPDESAFATEFVHTASNQL